MTETEEKKLWAPSPEHQLAITTHTALERLSGHTDDFDILEKTSHLKAGLEIPLMGVASMPDTLEKIYQHRKDATVQKIVIEEDEAGVFHKNVVEQPMLGKYKKLRYEHAISMMRSMDKHFLQLSVGVDGKRAEHIVKVASAIQTHTAAKEEQGTISRVKRFFSGKDNEE